MQAQQPQPCRGPDRDHQQARRRGRRLQRQGDVERDQRPLLEGDDEGRQIERQGKHPEERGRGHVGGDVGRHAQQQARGRRSQEDPRQAFPPGHGDGWRRGLGDSGRGPAGQPPGDPDQSADQEREDGVTAAPDRRLHAEPGQGLQDERIGQQGQEAAEVAGGVEDIGIAPSPQPPVQPSEPGLQQRRGRRERGERRAHRQGQHAEQPEDRMRRGTLPERGGDAERQDQARQDEHGDVDRHLPAHAPQPLQGVGVGIAQQQGDLEEGHAGVPHSR